MTVLVLEAICSIQRPHHRRILCRQEFHVRSKELSEVLCTRVHMRDISPLILKLNFSRSIPVVLNLGSIEPQEFCETVAGVGPGSRHAQ